MELDKKVVMREWRVHYPRTNPTWNARTKYYWIKKTLGEKIAGETEGGGDGPTEQVSSSLKHLPSFLLLMVLMMDLWWRSMMSSEITSKLKGVIAEMTRTHQSQMLTSSERSWKVLREVQRGGEGDLRRRKRLACREIRVDGDLLSGVNDVIHEAYRGGEQSLW